jgi:signal peptidase I
MPSPPADESSPPPPRKRRHVTALRILITSIILLAAMILWALLAGGQMLAQEVISVSMEPTVLKGDRLLVLMLEPDKPIHRGDIVMVDLPGEPMPLLKRLVAVPGDEVYIVGERVFVNHRPSPDDLLGLGLGDIRAMWKRTLGGDDYFVIGDNRSNSHDSVQIGPVHREAIVGRAVWRYSPVRRMGRVE